LLFGAALSSCAEDVTHGTGQGGAGGGGAQGGGAAGGSGATCGGFAAVPCPTDAYCDYGPSTCGVADGAGLCVTISHEPCDEVYQPVCGCDGTVHDNACLASAAGVDVNAFGGCTPPPGKFECGFVFCDAGVAYCKIPGSASASEDSPYTCVPLPAACGDTPSCECVVNERCGDMCLDDGAGNLSLTCVGG
jgi:hypothetical protein